MSVCAIDEFGLNYLFETDSLCKVNDLIYFSAKNYDALVSIDLKKHIAKIEKCFLDKYDTSYCAHAKLINYKHSIFCIPRYSKYVIKYDFLTKQSSTIEIPNVKGKKSVFNEAVQIDDRIICFPEFYEGIVSIDIESSQASVTKELKNYMPDKYIFVSNAVKNENHILIPFYNDKKILAFDKLNNEIFSINLEVEATGFSSIAYLDNKIYLIGLDHVLYIVTDEGKLLATQNNLNGVLYTIDNSIWLIDEIKTEIYVMEPNKSEMEHFTLKENYLEVLKDSKWIKSELIDGFIYILVQKKDLEMGLFCFNGKEEYYMSIHIENLYKELNKYKLFFEEHFRIPLPLAKSALYAERNVKNDIENIGSKIFEIVNRSE